MSHLCCRGSDRPAFNYAPPDMVFWSSRRRSSRPIGRLTLKQVLYTCALIFFSKLFLIIIANCVVLYRSAPYCHNSSKYHAYDTATTKIFSKRNNLTKFMIKNFKRVFSKAISTCANVMVPVITVTTDHNETGRTQKRSTIYCF